MSIDEKQLQETYLKSLASRIQVLRDQLEKFRAGDTELLPSIRRIAHTMTGSGATYGFPDISIYSRILEEAPLEKLDSAFRDLENVSRSILEKSSSISRNLLIIEDDQMTRTMLKGMVRDIFQTVDEAANGVEASQLIGSRLYSAILLDLILPDIDGREILIRIRENYSTYRTPVIVLSSISDEKHIRECYLLGANYFLTKPISRTKLLETLNAGISRADSAMGRDPLADQPELPDRDDFIYLVQDYFRAFPGEKPWLMMFNVYGEDGRISDRRLDALGTWIREDVDEIMDAFHCSSDDLIFLIRHMNNAQLDQLLVDLEKKLQPEKLKTVNIADIVKIRAAVRRPMDDKDIGNCVDILGKHLADDDLKDFFRCHIMEDRQAVTTRVLLMEDDDLITNLLIYRLQNDRFHFTRVRDGEEGLKKMDESSFDLVILDVKMPGMDGFHVLQILRRKYSKAELPVIMLTAMGKEKDLVRGFELGADDYILKPFSPQEVLARIKRLLRV